MDIKEIDDIIEAPHESSAGSKKTSIEDYIIVTDIVTDVTGYDVNNEAFHNARKHEILPLLKELQLVEYIERKYYIRLGTKEYCVELLKELIFNDRYIELAKSIKKKCISEEQRLELHRLKEEISYRVYSPLPYYHETTKGDFKRIKDQIHMDLFESMTSIQGFKLYKSEVLYIEAMKKNINRFLDALHIQSENYIQHLHEQENRLILSVLTNQLHPELNSISVEMKKTLEKNSDDLTYKRVYTYLHEDLYENLQNINTIPVSSCQSEKNCNDEYNQSTTDIHPSAETSSLVDTEIIEKSKGNKKDTIDYDSDVDIIEI